MAIERSRYMVLIKYFLIFLLVSLPVSASKIREIHVTDKTTGATQGVDVLGHADVIAHAHAEGGTVHLDTGDITASTDYQLIDISDTTNYPHDNTTWLHTAWIMVEVDSNNIGDYVIEFGFLDSVDATNGDFYSVFTVHGSKTAGQQKFAFFGMNPEGPKMRIESIATSVKSLNDVAFQTDVNLKTTLSPLSTASPAGNNDVVVRITVNAGTIDVSINMHYHSH